MLTGESTTSNHDRTLFYPCSGSDWSCLVQLYSDKVRNFYFADCNYQFDRESISRLISVLEPEWKAVRDSFDLKGPAVALRKFLRDEPSRKFRWIEPGWFSCDFINSMTNRRIHIVWRRGFGEYALAELKDSSVDIFCHRGDSDGEAGSAVRFLSNRRRRHPPLAYLFSKLTEKLADDAIIISDGSNTSFCHLLDAARGRLDIGYTECRFNLHWLLKSEIPWEKAKQYGRCYEWEVKKIPAVVQQESNTNGN